MGLPERPRVVLTGAASGLGRALALVLAPRGARLVLADLRQDALEETARLARSAGAPDVHALVVDVARLEDVVALEAAARERHGGTDLLVNNAGVAVAGRIGDVSIADWRWQIDVNLWGVIHGCHVFVPGMRAAGRGHVLNVASAAGLLSAPELGPYNVTKAGVVALSRTLQAEVRRDGVVVSVLCPSFFQSRLYERTRSPDERLGAWSERLVAQARWSAEDVARVALRDLERGRLHVVPQLEARFGWWAQRLWPAGVQYLLGSLHSMDALATWMERGRRAIGRPRTPRT